MTARAVTAHAGIGAAATERASKVALVVPGAEAGVSGQGRYVEGLHRGLRDRGVDVGLAPFRYLPLADRRSILELLPIGVRGAKRGDVLHLVRIKGASMLLARRLGPAVVTVHDLGILYCPEDQVLVGSLDRRAGLRLSLAGTRRADRVIAVSDFTRACLIRAGFAPERVTTVYEGVDGERFRPVPGAREEIDRRYDLRLGPADALVLYVGNELPRKNLGTLIRALARLRRDGVAFRFVKVGAPAYAPGRRALLREIAAHGLDGHVRVVDHVPDDDLPLFYGAATLYVQPSVWEGFGLPVLEAMACGAPVVAAGTTSLPEVCGDAARLVDPRDAEALARNIGGLIHDETERRRLRELGFGRAAGFTWAETAARTLDVYRAAA